MTATELREALLGDEVSPSEVTEHFLERIAALNPKFGAFSLVTEEAALERAAAMTRQGGGMLWGMPTGDKDLWDRAGVPTGFGSRAFAGDYTYAPALSGDVVKQIDAAGAVSLGKTSTPEFGLSAYTEPLAGPVARNPWDPTRTAGGSSGGAAVAVATGMLPLAPGSDGGGSIRIPAAACGLVGLKPTRGLLPADGGVDTLGGLTTAGPIARTVADTALLLEGMIAPVVEPAGAATSRRRRGYPYTLYTPAEPQWSYLDAALNGEVAGKRQFRIGTSTFSAWHDSGDTDLAPEARAALDAGIAALAGLGHDLDPAPRDPYPAFAPAFRTLWMAGASAIPIDNPAQLALLEPFTQWLVASGRGLGARQVTEALGAMAAFERATLNWLAPYDAIILPALNTAPPPLGWFDAEDPERNFEQQYNFTPYTGMSNVAGLPAITVPIIWTEPTGTAPAGLPMGIQLVGHPGGEHTLLALAAQLEQTLNWPARRPPC